jgi:putative ABC transport system permease protein
MPHKAHLSAWLAKRHFARRKLRNSLITVAVALSVALLVSSNIASQSIASQVVTTVRNVGGDVDLTVRKVTAEPFNESLLGFVAGQRDIISQGGIVAPRYSGKCILSGTDIPVTVSSVIGVDPVREQYFGFSNSSLLTLSNGNTIIATDDIAKAFSIINGSDIRIGITLANGTNRHLDLKVVSIAHIEGKGFSSTLLINITQAQWLFGTLHQINAIVVKLPDVESTPQIKQTLLQSLSSYEGIEVIAPKEQMISDVIRLVGGFTLGLNAVAAISLMSAVILTTNCLLMAANERRKEMGVLRAVGASRGALFKVFLFEAMIHGAIGGGIGIILGIFMSTVMTMLISGFTGYQPVALLLSPLTVLLSFLIGLGVTILGSLYPAFVASTTPPAKAMRVRARERGEGRTPAALLAVGILFIVAGIYGALSAANWFIEISSVFLIVIGSLFTVSALAKQVVRGLGVTVKPLLKANHTVTIRNVARNRRRTSLTMGVVSIGLTFVILIGSIQGSLTYGLNDFLYRQLGTDIMIRPASNVSVSNIETIGSINGVSHFSYCEFYVTSIGPASSSIAGYNLTAIAGIDTATFMSVTSVDLKAPTPLNQTILMNILSSNDRAIALSTKIAKDLGVSVGDNVTVLLHGSVHANLTVIALFFGSGFVQYGDVSLDVASLMSFEALTTLFGLPNSIGPIPNRGSTDGLILIKVTENETPNDVVQRIKSSGQLGAPGNLGVLTSESITTAFTTTVGEIVLLFQMLLVVSILIALLGLSTTMFMSVMERRREVGILMAMGMSKSEALRSVLGEALIIGLAGLMLGFIDALLLSWIFITAVASFGLYLPFIFPFAGVLVAVLLTVSISLLSGAYPARLTSKLKIVDAMRYE